MQLFTFSAFKKISDVLPKRTPKTICSCIKCGAVNTKGRTFPILPLNVPDYDFSLNSFTPLVDVFMNTITYSIVGFIEQQSRPSEIGCAFHGAGEGRNAVIESFVAIR